MPHRCCAVPLVDAVTTLARRLPADLAPTAFVLDHHASGWGVSATLDPAGLLGWRAPEHAWAVVVGAGARARPVAAAAHPDPQDAPVRVTVGVARDGRVAARLASGDIQIDEPPDSGRLLDVLRRALGVATPPPEEGTERLLAVLWLQRLAAEPATLTWTRAAALHPATALLAARGERLTPAELDAVIEVAAATWSWDVLRRAETSRSGAAALCPPGTADWFDDGSYARWVLAGVPDVLAPWLRATARLTPAARSRLDAALRRQGLLGGEVRRAG